MTNEIHDFKVGDEIWWFQVQQKEVSYQSILVIEPNSIELVHDSIKDIKDNLLICWHSMHHANRIWGKSRKEAWERLKGDIEKWGSVD